MIIAMLIGDTLVAAGLEVAGLASCKADASDLAPLTNIALVDVNPTDRPMRPKIGAALKARL
ncbi:hypothetical protein ACQZ52_18855 [Agrobacterium rosae]